MLKSIHWVYLIGLIEIRNLMYYFEGSEKPALDNISLDIERGEYILLTGPTGCGKSTLMRCLNGIIPNLIGRGKFFGDVIVDGLNTREHGVGEICLHVGMVLQNPESQILEPIVEDEVAFGPSNLNLPRDEVMQRLDDALRFTGIEGLRKKFTWVISGGQKQRVAIAGSLSMLTDVMILDEPTTDLDPMGADAILELTQSLNKDKGKTIILVEHKLEDVAKYADRLIVMDKGKIVLSGPPRDVLSNVKSLTPLGVSIPQSTMIGLGLKMKPLPLDPEEVLHQLKGEELRARKVPATFSIPEKVPPKETPVIEIRDLWYKFDDGTEALRGINLTIDRGDYVGVIGQNGSGKTTLVMHLLGFYKPTKGVVLVKGVDTRKMSTPKLAQTVGYLFQNPDNQLFRNTVPSEIAFGPENMKLPKDEINARVEEQLDTMELREFKDRHPQALSRGQRQRTAVASILSMKPEIIVLDEPTVGQDRGHMRQFMEFLRGVNRAGKTVIMISHDMTIVAQYAKRIVVLRDGKVLLDGATRDVFSKPEILAETRLKSPTVSQISHKLGIIPVALTVEELLWALKAREVN